jgi:replicative DNA helicase
LRDLKYPNSGIEKLIQLGGSTMVTETFLNECLRLIFSKKKRELEILVFQDIQYFLNSLQNGIFKGEIPVSVKSKFGLLSLICEHQIKGGSLSEILASIAISQKYKQYLDLIKRVSEPFMDQKEQLTQIKIIQDLVAWSKLNKTFKKFSDYEQIVMSRNFDTIEEVISEWKDLVKTASADVSEYELKSRNELVSSLNTRDDSLDQIIEEIRKKYSKQNVITSGIAELDQEFLNAGFQPSRLYMFAGTSGVGKSLLLLNMAIRASLSSPYENPFFKPSKFDWFEDSPQRIFLYITMENYPYETWGRLYCSLLKKTKEEMLKLFFNRTISSKSIKNEINEKMARSASSIQIDYFPANTISPATIAGLIQKYNQNPEEKSVKAVYIDYLDLLLPDQRREFYRLDLGEIASNLKSIAGTFEIPIITATQLNREAYRSNKKSELGSEMISESIQKLFISDFSAMMIRDDSSSKDKDKDTDDLPLKVTLKVDKNRDGKTGQTQIYFDYRRSRFLTKSEFSEEFKGILEI